MVEEFGAYASAAGGRHFQLPGSTERDGEFRLCLAQAQSAGSSPGIRDGSKSVIQVNGLGLRAAGVRTVRLRDACSGSGQVPARAS